ncbi:hypothetical protein YC2023_090266 [Brassica napus]
MVILKPFEVQNCTDASDWSVCLARGSCRGDEGLSINGAPFPSVDAPTLSLFRCVPLYGHDGDYSSVVSPDLPTSFLGLMHHCSSSLKMMVTALPPPSQPSPPPDLPPNKHFPVETLSPMHQVTRTSRPTKRLRQPRSSSNLRYFFQIFFTSSSNPRSNA